MYKCDELFRLDKKVALFVGVGGIGEKVTHGLYDFGADVIIGDINEEKAKTIAHNIYKDNSIKFKNINQFWVGIDITNQDSIVDALNHIHNYHKKIDIVVNMVGHAIFKKSFDMSKDEFERILAIDLIGAWSLSNLSAKMMDKEGRGGKIINAASITAFFGSPGQSGYAAAKAGLVNLTKTLGLEFIKKGIYVNAISPVMTETPLNTKWLSEIPSRRQKIAERIPMGRLGTPEDFVGPIIFLASKASNFVVGQTILVDGGTYSQHPLID